MTNQHAHEPAGHEGAGVHLPDPSIWPIVVGLASLIFGAAIVWWSRDGGSTFAGPLLGAAFFVLIRDVLATNLADFHVQVFGVDLLSINLTDSHLLIFGVLFILVVLILPGGLLTVWTWLNRRLAARPVLLADR